MEYKTDLTNYREKVFPEHEHGYYEIIIYLDGVGRVYFWGKSYPIKKGDIVLIPPKTLHCSVSDGGLKSLYVVGGFRNVFNLTEPVILSDNEREEGLKLAKMIYDNRYGNKEFTRALCDAYARFVLQNLKIQDGVDLAVNKIVGEILSNFYDSELDLNALLINSGYSEDYIRAHFKRINKKTPNEFLTDVRIRHACNLIDIYKNTMSLTEVAELCGYTDYVYFSRKFKIVKGVSPQKYKKRF
ncbi:MAG: helix-turn-helix transcriptional regulator [Clostridia bacterium]|nr:helix-turn-helix transcriptional regulator [Clostridia bacterium]